MQYDYGQNYGGGQGHYDYGGAPQPVPSWGNVPSWGVVPPNFNTGPYAESGYGQSSGYADSGYGQSSGDAYYEQRVHAEAEAAKKRLAAMEIMDRRNEVKEERRQVKLKQQRKAQKLEDNNNAAKIICFMGIWNAAMWALPCYGNSWNWRMFHGFGPSGLMITTSLLQIHVDLHCNKGAWGFGGAPGYAIDNPENKVCRLFTNMNGTHSLHMAMDLGCSFHFNGEACSAMTRLYYISFIVIVTFMLSALTSIMGGICMYYYYWLQPIKKIRRIALGCFVISPSAGIIGFAIYSALSPDLGDIPRAWTSIVSTIDGGLGTFAVRPTNEGYFWVKCGWCWFFCWISMAFAIAGTMVFLAFFKKHPNEKAEMKAIRKEKRQMEREIEKTLDQAENVEFEGYTGGKLDSNYPAGAQQPLYKESYDPGGSYGASTAYASGQSGGYSGYPSDQGSHTPSWGYSAPSSAAGVGGYPGYPQYAANY